MRTLPNQIQTRELGNRYNRRYQQDMQDEFALNHWRHRENASDTGSVETLVSATDKYDIANFARDDPQRFLELVKHLSPRDQEIILCFAVLQKRPTDLSILFGKAGHRAEEDLHKAAHKLAGLVEFGVLPELRRFDKILERQRLSVYGEHSFAACLWQYSRCRDFLEASRLLGQAGLRQQMLRAFKILHAAEGREEGLLAGWILWLVDGSDPKGKGWRKRKRTGRQERLGPLAFHAQGQNVQQLQAARPAAQKGGQRQRTCNVKITRRMKFVLRGMNG